MEIRQIVIKAIIVFIVMLEYLSSPIRWCESKLGQMFLYSPYIVEFWNSITSLVFCFFALIGYFKYKKYCTDNIPWLLFFSIGITSFLFHSTMSFTGQFLDEFSIILLLTYCLKIYYNLGSILYFILTTMLSLISWYYPSMSPPILLVSGLSLIITTYFRKKSKELLSLWKVSIYIGILAIMTWLFDFICITNTHMYWHIIVSMSVYLLIVFVLKSTNKITNIELY